MTSIPTGTNPRRRLPGVEFLTRISCDLQGWIVGWATTIFASATVHACQTGSGMTAGALAAHMLDIADAVPPVGKLTLGGLFALMLLASSGIRRSRASAAVVPVAAGAAAMASALALPIGYYPAELGLEALAHLFAGALGGAAFAAARAACRIRKEKRT
jgi:hypothetical protein